jgi:hypothetical protein
VVCFIRPAKAEFIRDTQGRIFVSLGLGTDAKPTLLKPAERRSHPRVEGSFKKAEDVAYTLYRKEKS